MNRILALLIALGAAPAMAAEVTSTRDSAYDFQTQTAAGVAISNHTRFDTAFVACLNNPQCVYVQGGRYRITRGAAPPVEPPPVAVDCAVSAYALSQTGTFGACASGIQSRTDTWTRSITRQPANGGAACPALSEPRVVTQPCTVTPPPPLPVGSAFPLYPSLDLSQIPWHVGAGAWGPQVQILAPAVPVTTRQVSVSTASAFNTAASVTGSQITITAGWTGGVTINANDVDVIINRGVAIGSVEIGAWPRTTPRARIRIRGPVAGTHSGGRMGQYRDQEQSSASSITDVVIDGIDINGASGFGTGETNQAFRTGATRIAVLNSRVIAPAYTWLGSAKHVVIANSNFYHGAASRSQVGIVEGWGIRNTGGPITIVDSRIQGTRYHNIRAQSVGGAGELLYVTRSTLVAQAEGRTAWLWNNLNQTTTNGQGAIFEGNDIYTYAATGCGFGTEISTANVTWSMGRNNRYFGAGAAVMAAGSLPSNWQAGNTFAPLVSLPAWGGPGDPRQVPLPSGWSVIAGEGSCPGFGG